MAPPNYYWVTWPRTGDEAAARKGAMIWGPQPDAPPQLSDMFLAGPFRTKDAAQNYENAIGKNTIIPPKGTPIVGNVQNPISAITDPLQAIGDFFSKLGQPNVWLRVGEVLLGVVLIGIGLAHLTGVDNVVSKAVGATPVGRVGKVLK